MLLLKKKSKRGGEISEYMILKKDKIVYSTSGIIDSTFVFFWKYGRDARANSRIPSFGASISANGRMAERAG